jgi:hypothetical protein
MLGDVGARYWAARVPEDHVQADNPWGTLTRWLVIEEGDGGCLIHQPDEHSGRVWDNWAPDRAAADEVASLFGIHPGDWTAIGALWEWPAGQGWPPSGWTPAPIDDVVMDKRRTAWDAAFQFASEALQAPPEGVPEQVVEEIRALVGAGDLRRVASSIAELTRSHESNEEFHRVSDAVQRYARIATEAPPSVA